MMDRPAVVVHGLEGARIALAPGRPVLLVSGPGAAVYAGSGWWRAMVAAARAEFPATEMDDLLDCGAAPGRALEALRLGLKNLVLDPECPAFPAVQRVAVACGARLFNHRPAALDLAQPGARRRLAAWLDRRLDQELGRAG